MDQAQCVVDDDKAGTERTASSSNFASPFSIVRAHCHFRTRSGRWVVVSDECMYLSAPIYLPTASSERKFFFPRLFVCRGASVKSAQLPAPRISCVCELKYQDRERRA